MAIEKQRKVKEEAEMLEKAKKIKREALEKEKIFLTVKALQVLDKKSTRQQRQSRSSSSSSSSSYSSSSSDRSRKYVACIFFFVILIQVCLVDAPRGVVIGVHLQGAARVRSGELAARAAAIRLGIGHTAGENQPHV